MKLVLVHSVILDYVCKYGIMMLINVIQFDEFTLSLAPLRFEFQFAPVLD